ERPSVIPDGARAPIRNPEPGSLRRDWSPGSRLAARPGMTAKARFPRRLDLRNSRAGRGVAPRHWPRHRRGGLRRVRIMPTVENNRIVETPTEARAGATGHNVRYVLGIGIVAVIIAFAIVYLIYFG